MTKNNANLFVPSDYSVWTSLLGVAMPTSPSVAPGAGWYECGLLSDSGITESHSYNESKIFDLAGRLQRIARNQEERPFTFETLEQNRIVSELRYTGSSLAIGSGTATVQTVTINGTPTGGTFTLSGGAGSAVGVTAPIAYNAASSVVQTAIQTLPGLSGAAVTGSAGGPYTVTFPASLGPVSALTRVASLTGGSSPDVAIVVTTPGVAPIATRSVGGGTGRNIRQFLVYLTDAGKHKLFTIANGEAEWTGTVGYTSSGASISQFSLQPYLDSSGNYFQILDDDPAQALSYA